LTNKEKVYGIGLMGTAHVHAGWYAREFREAPQTKLLAVVDDDLKRAHTMLGTEASHVKSFYTDPAEMLKRKDIDIVCIASETSKHLNYAESASEAGKHICMEKVLETNLEKADKIIKSARKAGVKLICPPFVHDSNPVTNKTKELIDNGYIGKPNLAHFHTGHEGLIYSRWEEWFYDPEQSAGGALVDLGVHALYDSLYLFGEAQEISSVMTTVYTERMLGDYPLKNIKTEDNAITTIKFKNKMITVSDVSFTRMADKSNNAIYGTEGTIILHGSASPLMLYSPKNINQKTGQIEWKNPKVSPAKPGIEVIIQLIEKEEGTWRVNGKWARDVLEIVVAAYQSAKTQKTVTLPV
jgi:predicted dehydrogenase